MRRLGPDDELEPARVPLRRWWRMTCPHDENADICELCSALLDQPVEYVPVEHEP